MLHELFIRPVVINNILNFPGPVNGIKIGKETRDSNIPGIAKAMYDVSLGEQYGYQTEKVKVIPRLVYDAFARLVVGR